MDKIEIVQLLCAAAVCIYSAASDIHHGTISNKVLAVFAFLGITFDIIYYGFSYHPFRAAFIVNLILASGLALLFFYMHIWAGGDSKLLITTVLLYPVKFCVTYHENKATYYFVVMFAFSLGFIYLVISSFIERIKKRKRIDLSQVLSFLRSFVIRYLLLTIYTSLFTLINRIIISRYFILNSLSLSVIYFLIPWIIAKFNVFRKKVIILLILGLDIILSIAFGILPVVLNLKSYAIVLLSALMQALVTEFNYETIKTSEVQKGMILSLPTTILFMNSRVKGLPGLSTEDLASRLTEEEADSVRRWESSAAGKPEVIIVRKIPFAIFISLGVLVYFIFWSYVK